MLLKKYLAPAFFLIWTSFVLTNCAKKGENITEPLFGTIRVTTFTVDTFRFKILLNGEMLTDSLASPIGSFSGITNFTNPAGKLQVIDITNNNQLVLDTTIQQRTGTSIFSFVQFVRGQKPFIPPIPNEPPPAPGNYKIRFRYTTFSGDGTAAPPQDFFFPSIRCVVRKNGVPVDTIVLQKNEESPFYESTGTNDFTLRIENPANGLLIDAVTSPPIGKGYSGFNTVSVSGKSSSNYFVERIY